MYGLCLTGYQSYGNLISPKKKKKMTIKIVPSWNHVSTTVWLHHLDFKKVLGEIEIWELHKAARCSFEQILETELHSHLPSILQIIYVRWTRYAGHSWWSWNKLINDILQWTPTHGHTSIGWTAKIYIHQLCVETWCSLENLPIGMDDDRESRGSMLSTWLNKDGDAISIQISKIPCFSRLFYNFWSHLNIWNINLL